MRQRRHLRRRPHVFEELGADIGLALDGDGDRLIVCDEHGEIVGGDHIMAICPNELLKQRKLKKKTLAKLGSRYQLS